MPLVSFYTPWKHQKTSDFLMFSGGIERASGMKWINPIFDKKSFEIVGAYKNVNKDYFEDARIKP